MLTESIYQSQLFFRPGLIIDVQGDYSVDVVIGDSFYDFALYAVDMIPAKYTPYGEGIRLISAPVTAVVSRDAAGKEIGRMDIPAEIQALEGYGMGISSTVHNSLEWDENGNLLFSNRLSRTHSSWSVSYYAPAGETLISTAALDSPAVNVGAERVLCNKFPFATAQDKGPRIYKAGRGINIFPGKEYTKETWAAQLAAWEAEGDPLVIWYERADPIVTKLETFDNLIAVNDGGTITFENEHTQAVPNRVIYQQ